MLVATGKSEEELRDRINTVPEIEEIVIERLAVGSVEPADEKSGPSDDGKPRGDASRRLIDKHLSRKATTVRVDTGVLDELINIVG